MPIVESKGEHGHTNRAIDKKGCSDSKSSQSHEQVSILGSGFKR